ncbi:MAG: RNA 2',3'-cyclic phosphodiesterase [Desulfobacteraceae bacterium]|nr:RNA 2',3'-cyclic phosphodiesterase [Desulfobacteraceae bacterium]
MNHYKQNHQNENIRAFIAISFPKKVIIHLKNMQVHLKAYKFKASWPKPSNMHLTLKFLGDIPVSKIQDINQSIHKAVLEFKREDKKLSLLTEGIGVFPSVKKPRIIWEGVQDQTAGLNTIQSLLEKHLGKTGFKKEKKRFFPHITLCRLKQSVSEKRIVQILENHSEIKSDTFLINSITLFKSELSSSGAIHTKLIHYTIT